MPLHPIVVHIPLVLAGLIPIVAGWLTWRTLRGASNRRAWAAALALQAVVLGGALVALRTGGQEEERVEERVPEAAIEVHEERAEAFTIGAGVVGALLLAAVALRGRGAAAAGAAATVAAAVVVLLGVRTGEAGGQLVYVHDAPAAYAQPGAATSPRAVAGDGAGDHDDD